MLNVKTLLALKYVIFHDINKQFVILVNHFYSICEIRDIREALFQGQLNECEVKEDRIQYYTLLLYVI